MSDLNLLLERALRSGITKLGLDLEGSIIEHGVAQSIAYIQLLQKWNQVYNLTAVRDPLEMVSRHIIDSLSLVPYVKAQGNRILDVGTGAGLPGLPLSFVFPDRQFTLLDSNQKRQIFLGQVVQTLHLNNVALQCIRTENYQPVYLFDAIVSRAFAPLDKMLALTGHLLAPGGRFLAMKGKLDSMELESIGSYYKIEEVIPLSSFGHLIIIMRN